MIWMYGRCSLTYILWLLLFVAVPTAAQESGPSGVVVPHEREAFFNRTSYVRIAGQVSLRSHLGLSFRTCAGGQLFTQRNSQQSLALEVLPEGLVLTAQLNPGPGIATTRQFRVTLNARFLDNAWHTVNIVYRLGNLTLSANGHQQVIANSTYNQELLSVAEINYGVNNELHVGYGFVGCILEGPGLVFSNATQAVNVQWGPCPLTPNSCSKVDHCLVEPCMMHGQCVSRPDRYQCHCAARYSGNNCQIDNGSPCLKNPCKNNGICQETPIGDYYCQCRSGFTGQHCDTEMTARLCDNSPCKHGGTCSVNPLSGQYECQCPAGYTGRDCHLDINECLSTPCLNGGVCVDKVNDYACLCNHTGYEGANCEINIDECERKPCLNGVCFDNYGGYTCQCSPGFGGLNCEMNLNECASDPCQNNGTCTDQVGSYRCDCQPGFTGHNCHTSLNANTNPNPNSIDCRQSPCPPHATCLNINATYMCVCEHGYFGDQCEKKVDDCTTEPCLNGGVCVDLATGGFTCNCSAEYTGALCQLVYDACSSQPCKNNATCKHLQQPAARSRREYICQCPPGFAGSDCETSIDECAGGVACGEGKQCVEGMCRPLCPEGWGGDNCSLRMRGPASSNGEGLCQQMQPCKNNATCVDQGGDYQCVCPKGWTGKNCDQDVDECEPNPCIHGICQNTEGGYQCFCKPGYSGDHCDLDFDECLSNPCLNGALCNNLVNNYQCVCPPGYTGRNCDTNIDECASNPCQNGATCVDGIAQFSCQCPEGLTGKLCETNIDDCEPQPCLHNGECIDGLNNYTCNCTDTGYEGMHCEINIDDCKDNLCENGAVCEDQVKDYQCKCYPGYSGKNCEVDINECEPNPCQYGGTCLELSNATLYQVNSSLPAAFQQNFSYAAASGYACVCVPGVRGDNCEENINECESSPCYHGKCHDLIDGYRCDCEPGYEGPLCNIDINECEQYRPCMHGECYDQKAGYLCVCDPRFGGKNCSVELTGCKQSACLNGGTCKPYLLDEVHHLFNCSCGHGYHGNTCQQSTTMSLTGHSSYIMANTTRDEGYEIHFRFKTTLPNGLLALGRGSTFYFLELVQGKLNLHSSLLNKWEGVTIGSKLNDSNWQKVFVAINTSHLVLAANEEQTIYPINQNEGTNASHTSFPTTYIGGTISTLRRLPMPNGLIPYFVGCIQDIFVNGLYVLPSAGGDDSVAPTPNVQLQNVEAGCPRHEQCDPNPCHSGGHCTDLWRNFSCTCERPYLGHTCQYNLTAATFGRENTTNSLVVVEVWPAVRATVQSILDISMFVRTRQAHGAIFYLGSRPNTVAPLNETLITARLQNGELQVSIQFSGIIEAYTVGGVRLDNGNSHLIQVVRNVTLVQVKINSTEYFRKTISATGKLDLQVLYLGGMPAPPQPKPHKRQIAAESTILNGFKGVIQDVQVSNGSQTMVVEFFPLSNSFPDDLIDLPPSLGLVAFDPAAVLEGVVSDDSCADNPCLQGGTCRVTWNDFVCECTRGHKGKRCEEMELCELKRCPEGSVCRNVEAAGEASQGGGGYECAANITLSGHQGEQLTYSWQAGTTGVRMSPLAMDSVQLAFRSRTGGTILYVGGGTVPYFQVSALGNQITVAWQLSGDGPPQVTRMQRHADSASGEWITVELTLANDTLSGGIANEESESARLPETPFSSAAWLQLLQTAPITVGGTPVALQGPTSGVRETYYLTDAASGSTNELDVAGFGANPHQQVVGGAFKGCIGQVRIGGLLLPYFTPDQLDAAGDSPPFTHSNHFALAAATAASTNLTLDCLLCFQAECINGGRCANETESYLCDCPAGFMGDYCEVDINECENNLCSNGAVCVDGIANYTCSCLPGWEGWLCDKEIDECASSPCLNSGTCVDKLGAFECLCLDEYVGERCDQLKQVTCQNKPCRNNAACADVKNPQTNDNFTCSCAEGFVGTYCETAYCVLQPCENGGLCLVNRVPPMCQCERGFEGAHCERDIDDCLDKPCLHNSQCIDRVAAFHCNCTGTGYKGMNCEDDVDECVGGEDPCQGRGKCVNTQGGFRCDCIQGYCGQHCHLPDPCLEMPCQNGGSCSPMCVTFADFECSCTLGFSGKNCSESNLLARSNVMDIALIVGPVIAILLIAAGVSLTVFVMMARKKRATRGTYSPSSQEYCNPRVELDNVMKPPPEERLI
ncbi:protein crumbs isoform X2 [Nilaparvata lugens]|uniref:protein crumbs isoform X2 n=1 Tax=Nilaparvata lugens TaxID=108931 RepID=UPI00193DB755|nr:protein crumbs isoform X2 [Nilaparvata lugens]